VDLRKNDPYSVYPLLDFEIPVGRGEKGTAGDCWDRYMVRVREMEQSVNIIEQAVERLPAGMSGGRAEADPARGGDVYVRTETPKGSSGTTW